MKVMSTNSKEKGGLSALLFHCFFNGDESITHYMHNIDSDLYEELTNLYAVCIASTTDKRKTVLAGFVIKTSYTHNDTDFIDTLINAVSMEPQLNDLIGDNTSFLPARLGITGNKPPTETEMLRIMVGQHLKFSE
jgi:hypothetical protein